MPKGQKTRVAYITDWDMCPVCGYTCQNFKDLKIQKHFMKRIKFYYILNIEVQLNYIILKSF